MFNVFRHPNLNWDFSIPFRRQLSQVEAETLIELWAENEKSKLFNSWIAKPTNKGWAGDEETKKEEIFLEFHNRVPGESKFLFVSFGDSPSAIEQSLEQTNQVEL